MTQRSSNRSSSHRAAQVAAIRTTRGAWSIKPSFNLPESRQPNTRFGDLLTICLHSHQQQQCKQPGHATGTPYAAEILGFRWSGRRDSNPRPRPWQGRALPLSYARSALLEGSALRGARLIAACFQPHNPHISPLIKIVRSIGSRTGEGARKVASPCKLGITAPPLQEETEPCRARSLPADARYALSQRSGLPRARSR
jgi:hypothetical protein